MRPPSGRLQPPPTGLKEPGMVKVHNRTQSTKRVEILVPAGDELDVSEDVANQLEATRVFTRGDAPEIAPTGDGADVEAADDDVTCEECGFVAKSPGGLAAHQRKHED